MMQDLSIFVVIRVPWLDELRKMEIGTMSAYHVRRDVCCQLKPWSSELEPVQYQWSFTHGTRRKEKPTSEERG